MMGARYDKDGRYVWVGTIDPEVPGFDNTHLYVGHVNPTSQYHDVESDVPKDMPGRPSAHHEFDFERKKWVFDAAKAWVAVRVKRNSLLVECDWRLMPDAPTTVQQRPAWEAYRAALRDITKQTDPMDISWPVSPR